MRNTESIPTVEDRPMTPREFADSLGVQLGNVKRWRSEGMPSESLPDGSVVVRPTQAIPWLEEHTNPSTFGKRCRVYFASKGALIKIGSTVDVRRRMKELGTTLLVDVPGGKPAELAFHALFASASAGEEWFRPVPELLTIIDSLKAA